MQKRKELSREATEDEAEDEEREIDEDRSDEEDTKVQKVDTRQISINEEKEEANENQQETAEIGQCAICHIIINDANLGGSIADSEQERCSEGYLLCQHCVRNFSIRSG